MHDLGTSFLKIADIILKEDMTVNEWAEVESDDMFEEGEYVGGFDATEMEFCFSVYIDKKEYWFQLPLEEIKDALTGKIKQVDCRPANT